MKKSIHSTGWMLLFAALGSLPTLAARAEGLPVMQEEGLMEVLRTGQPADKALACKQLAICGTKQAVPLLAPLLADEELASWARIALEAIPDPAADEALREGVKSLDGLLLVGAINSSGVRRDAGAVEPLIDRLTDKDAAVASAAAVALGRVANDAAIKSLRQALKSAPPAVRSAVAEGCVLCAERLAADGKGSEAAAIYDEVRKAEVPQQRQLEATRGAILARGDDGIPLLIEQLHSTDKKMFQVGLTTARELPGQAVADALAAELASAPPETAALLLYALADRPDAAVSPAVLQAAKAGEAPLRIAAIGLIRRSGDQSSVAPLLEVAAAADAEVAQAAKRALADLPGDEVDAAIVARLAEASDAALPIVMEVIGQRRIEATPQLVKGLGSASAATRHAALTALGETVPPAQLPILIEAVIDGQHPEDAAVAMKALQAASIRMPDRNAAAAALAAALPKAPTATQAQVLQILGSMGGQTALDSIAAAMKGSDEQLQDAGSRVLGEWMDVDAAPVLLDLAKTAGAEKYRVRALRGYLRLARQFKMDDQQRAAICREAIKAAGRIDEQRLALEVVQRYPSLQTLQVAVEAAQIAALKDDASRVALLVGEELGTDSTEVQSLLSKIGVKPLNVEIIRALYGAGEQQFDVTEKLQQCVGKAPRISLPSPNYNESFGRDPAPGTPKQLQIRYRINGVADNASFDENAAIVLPMPK